MERRALYRADWILPVASPPLHRGELLVTDDGRIAAVAPAGALDIGPDIPVRELGRAILLPGLVNVHAHPELAMFRGWLEDLPFRDWILRLVGGRRTRLLPEDSLAAATWSMAEALAAGMTTVAATEPSSAAAVAMTACGIRGVLYQEVFGPDPHSISESMQQLEADLEKTRSAAGARIDVGISPHAPYTVSDPLYREVARLAIAEGLPMAVHIAESRAERELVVTGAGDFAPGLRERGIETPIRARSPIALLESLGILGAKPLLIHAVDVDEADLDVIAAAGCAVAHCPIANAKLGHGHAPVLEMFERRITVGLGTDSVGSNNRLDLLEEARFAALLHRATSRRYDVLPAHDLLRLCTIEGARALGLDDRIGTLEPGKEADLCAVSLDAVSTAPAFDPVTTLFHAARGSDVVLTMVGGDVLYEYGRHTTIDVERARIDLDRAANRLRDDR